MDQYINQLLKERGVKDDMDPEIRRHMAEELTSRVSDFINRRLVESMEESALPGFEALLDEQPADQQKVQAYITAHVPNTNEVVAKAMMQFRAVYLGLDNGA